MILRYKNKEYNTNYNVKTNTVEVETDNKELLELINIDRIQRGLLIGTLLNNPYYNLDECLKNKKL